jgi:tRNA threonylcarbamoyl adenosine modification protein (Sua5/YciO/YrdC/YwlC family)
MILSIHPDNPESRIVAKTAEALSAGEVVVYPTDTVYGIGCSIESRDAIERVYLLKRQRRDKPFSFVCSDLKHISEYARVGNAAFKIMKRLIPGPYTFILPAARMKQLPKILVSKRKTVGIRVPDYRFTLAVVRRLGHPILSTSATDEDGMILSSSDAISRRFRNLVDIIIDAGTLASEPSTVLDLTGDTTIVVREGAGDTSAVAR